MYLHKDREMFKDVVEQTAEKSGKTDYWNQYKYYFYADPCSHELSAINFLSIQTDRKL